MTASVVNTSAGSASLLLKRLLRYDAVGFDIDLTLSRYQIRNLISLVYGQLTDYLVRQRGYPSSLRQLNWHQESRLMSRAVVVDKARGNLLLLDTGGSVLRACHGTRRMTHAELALCYPPNGRPEFADQLLASGYQHERDGRYRFHDTHYDLPGSLVFAKLVDLAPESFAADFTPLWEDCYDALLHVYSDEGPYFRDVLANLSTYLCPVTPRVRATLAELRRRGRYLFLLSSSQVAFGVKHLNYILGADWANMFDCVILAAGKPGFFRPGCENPLRPASRIAPHAFVGGSAAAFHQHLGAAGVRLKSGIGYFGDSVRCDLTAVQCGWDVWMVIEELGTQAGITGATMVPGLVERLLPLITLETLERDATDVRGSGLIPGLEEMTSASASDMEDCGDFAVNGRATLWAALLAEQATAVLASLEDLPIRASSH